MLIMERENCPQSRRQTKLLFRIFIVIHKRNIWRTEQCAQPRDQLSNTQVPSQAKRSFLNNISLLFPTFRILRAPGGLTGLFNDQVTFVFHGQTHQVGAVFTPGDRGPDSFLLLRVHHQVVVCLHHHFDSPVVGRVGVPAGRPLVDDKVPVLLWLVEIKGGSYCTV